MVDVHADIPEDGDVDGYEGSVSESMLPMKKMQALTEFCKQPNCVKNRVKALKKLLHSSIILDTEYYQEIFEIEKKYEARHLELWNQRKKIVSGAVEPTEEECEWTFDDELQEFQLVASLTKQAQIGKGDGEEKVDEEDSVADAKGIPKFWLKVLLHNSLTEEMITEADRPILDHLEDIRCILIPNEKPGFIIEFHFSENEYFSNQCLTKQYFFNQKPPADSPLDYDGPEICHSKGCTINWKPSKNVTIKVMKKVKKHKNRKDVRTITKTVKKDSFFNFFDPHSGSLTDPDVDDETIDLLNEDFKIGHHLREYVIPRAVLFYTGEACEDDLDEDDDDESDDDDDDDVEDCDGQLDDSEDECPKPKRAPRGRRGGHGSAGAGAAAHKDVGEKPECQQS